MLSKNNYKFNKSRQKVFELKAGDLQWVPQTKLTSGFSSKDSFCFKLSIANLSAIGVPGGRRVLGTVAGVWCRFLVKWVPSEEGLAEPALGGSFTCSKCFPFFFVAPLAADGERALALEDHPFQHQIKVTFSNKVQLSILERSSWPFTPYHQYAYSLYCSLYISRGADKEKLLNNQELLKLVII